MFVAANGDFGKVPVWLLGWGGNGKTNESVVSRVETLSWQRWQLSWALLLQSYSCETGVETGKIARLQTDFLPSHRRWQTGWVLTNRGNFRPTFHRKQLRWEWLSVAVFPAPLTHHFYNKWITEGIEVSFPPSLTIHNTTRTISDSHWRLMSLSFLWYRQSLLPRTIDF